MGKRARILDAGRDNPRQDNPLLVSPRQEGRRPDEPGPGEWRRRERRTGERQAVDLGLLESVRDSMMSDAAAVTPSRVAAAVQATGKLLGTAG